mmetsp:Transcript_98838/g.285272  ORF Transcript_98838/g.285272 Transcript_98838/m.285272 type:complete len:278 (-) Transcript_98838:1539-2372(-)
MRQLRRLLALRRCQPRALDQRGPALERGAPRLVAQHRHLVCGVQQRQQVLGNLRDAIEEGAPHLQAVGLQKLHRLQHLLELRRPDLDQLAIPGRHCDVLIVIVLVPGLWRCRVLGVQLQRLVDIGQQVGQEGRKISLQALADALRGLRDVLPLQVVRIQRCLHYRIDRLVSIRQKLLLANSNPQQGHAFERLAPQAALLLPCCGHDQLLQHRHDGIVVPAEVLPDVARDHSDTCDRLLLDASVLRALQLSGELFHEALRIARHQRGVQTLAEGDKCR